MISSLNDTFEPVSLKEVFGNSIEISKLTETLKKEPFDTYIISGPNGIGKSTIIKLILTQLNYKYIFYDSITYNNDSIIDKMMNLNHNNIICKFNNVKPQIISIIIDNYDHITLSNEKNIIDNLLDFNYKRKKIPVILIIGNNSYKLLEEFKKKYKIFFFKHLTPIEIFKYTEFLLKKLNINYDNKSILNTLINFAQKDIRRLKLLLQDIALTLPNLTLTEELIDNYILHSRIKNKDFNLFESYKDMLVSSNDFNKLLSIYNNEKVLLPLIIHENYYKDIHSKKYSNYEKLELCKNISDYISKGDVIETDIYSYQNWHLQDYHCFISCIKPIQLLNNLKNYIDINEINYIINFSSELNKTSLKNINRKNFTTLSCNFPEFDINDLLEIGRILNYYFQTENYDKIKEFINHFSKTDVLKMIEVLIKIDKCNPNNFVLTTKIKKLINI